MLRRAFYGALGLAVVTGSAGAQAQAPADSVFMAGMRWRSIGPANMSGRITDVEGLPSPSRTFYVASAAGGIWKTTNGGTTFRPLFQNERVVSMGDLAIAPSDTLQIWAGTGEEDSRNSISPGAGIYKSTNGGLTWTFMGLEKTGAISRVIVHPTNPNVVWVAALGQPWGSNPERGLYKTTDGGRTWQLKKFISDKAGFIDLIIHPTNPDVLFAASWERVRGPYFLQSGGPGSALWKSTDGGETWTEVKGGGFPATMKGRIGLDISRSNPNVIYALVEAAPPSGPAMGVGCRQAQAGGCGLYRSQDGGATWEWMARENVRPFYYSQVRVDPKDPNRVYWSSTPVKYSNDGGRTSGNTTVGLHVDHHAMWIDPNDPNRIIVGNDGGIGISFDKGGSWIFPNTFAIGQFYAISFDMDAPYNVCGGLQDNGSWCGPSRRPSGAITNSMWFNSGGGDGFYTAQDPRFPWLVYSESQGGNMGRYDLRTGERVALRKPTWRDTYIQFEDSVTVETGSAQNLNADQRRRVADLRRRQTADSTSMNLRYNWNTPFFLSPHNPDVFYAASNRVLKSTFRGDNLRPISPDLSTNDTAAIRVSTETTGGVTPDITGAETFSTITTIAESPVVRGKLFAGTDDGNVWMSPNDGGTWTNLTAKFRGLVPAKTYVSRIEPSNRDANTFYITFDGHRTNDYKPYVFITTDNGTTFRSIVGNLPTGAVDFVHVIREDLQNPNLLFVGTDVGVYVSLDKGATWSKFMHDLPTVPVHDLKIHPRDRELIAGTHGRSIWVVDIAPLQQLSPTVLAEGGAFLTRPGFLGGEPPMGGGNSGHMAFQTTGAGGGADITYWLPTGGGARANIAVVNARGDTIHTMTGPGTRGLQKVNWNLRARTNETVALSPAERRDSALIMRRLDAVADSLIKAGGDRTAIERMVAQIRDPQEGAGFGGGFGGGGGGGGGGQNTGWVERPGETPAMAGGQQQGGGGGGGGNNPLAQTFQRLLRLDGGRPSMYQIRGLGGGGGGGGFGGAAGTAFVAPGEYTVVVKAGGRTFTTKLRVEQDPDLVAEEGR